MASSSTKILTPDIRPGAEKPSSRKIPTATSPASEIPAKLVKAARRFKLTKRELEVFALLILGEQWKTTADGLGISVSMVRVHSKNLLRKIRATTIANAVAKILWPDTYAKTDKDVV